MHSDRSAPVSIGVFLAVLLLALAIGSPDFFTRDNVLDVLTSASYLSLIGLGMMVVVLTGHIDVSLGAVVTVCAVAGAELATNGVPLLAVIALTVALGAGLQVINAVLVTRFAISSIIVTLGTASIFTGMLIKLTDGGAQIVGLPQSYLDLAQGKLLGIPHPVLFAGVALGLAGLAFRHLPAARALFAVGSNDEAARLAGVRVRTAVAAAFVINGMLAAFTALLVSSEVGSVQSDVGTPMTLQAISVAVVGGTNVFGGSGSVLGVAMAAVLLQTIATALTYFSVDPLWQQAVQGAFIVLALAVYTVRARRSPGALAHA
jgi:ribose/xylose/arabinose/galactoside ABC-type transport system permease subunit